MIGFVSRLSFEIACGVHHGAAITTIAALFHHTKPSPRGHGKIYWIVIISLYGVVLILCTAKISLWSRGSRAYIIGYDADNVVQIAIHVRRPWRFRPSQFVYLTIPGVSSSAFLQSHPFTVAWWDVDESKVFFLVAPQKEFTGNLVLHRTGLIKPFRGPFSPTSDLVGNPGNGAPITFDMDNTPTSLGQEYTCLIDEPYGKDINLSGYGTILMVATRLGIAGQLPFIKYIMDCYRDL